MTLEACLFAGNRSDIALAFTLAYGALLLAVVLTDWGRTALERAQGLGTAAALFGLTLIAILATLVPHAVGDASGARLLTRPSIEPLATAVEAVKLLGYACAFAASLMIGGEDRRSRAFLRAIVIGSSVAAVFCLAAEALSPLHLGGWTKPYITRGRISGLYSSANTAATAFAVYALIAGGEVACVASRQTVRSLRQRVLGVINARPSALIALCLNVFCLVLTASRGGILMFAASFLGLCVWLSVKRPRLRAILLAIAGVVAVIGLLVSGVAVERYAKGAYGEDLRGTWMGAAWAIFLQSPGQGWGLGALPRMFLSVATDQTFGQLDWAGAAHNVYLQWLAEGGLVAAVPMWGVVLWILVCAADKIPQAGSASIRRPALIAALLLVLVHSVIEYALQEPAVAVLFSVLLGLGMGQASLTPSARMRGA